MIPENGITLDTILEGILTEGDDVEEAVRTMRSDLLRAAMPILSIPSSVNVKAEQPDSCSDSMVCPKPGFVMAAFIWSLVQGGV